MHCESVTPLITVMPALATAFTILISDISTNPMIDILLQISFVRDWQLKPELQTLILLVPLRCISSHLLTLFIYF